VGVKTNKEKTMKYENVEIKALMEDKNVSPDLKRAIMPREKQADILTDLIRDGYDLTEVREALKPVKQEIKK
jgi:hypothetical protein